MADDDGPEVLDLGVVDEPDTRSPGPRAGSDPGGARIPRRAVLTLAGLAVLGGGVAVVRSGDPSPPRAAPAPAPSPSTASVRPSPRTLPPGQVVVTQLPQPPLGGAPLDVFGFSDTAVVRVDLATGRITRTSLPPLSDAGLSFVAVRGGVLVHRDDGGATYLVHDAGGVEEAPAALAGSGPMLPGPDLDHVWVMGTSGPMRNIRLLGIDGRPTQTIVGLAAYGDDWPTPDGGGFPLQSGVGGSYWARPQGLTRVTTGAIIAAGPTGWLVLECDERDRCSASLVDRSTERHEVPGLVGTELAGAAGGRAVPYGVLAPDGRRAAFYVGDPTRALRLVVVDLRSGDAVRTDLSLVAGAVSQSLVWSPTARWVFGVDSSANIVAVDPERGGVQLVVPDTLVPALPVVQSIAVRPAA